MSLMSLPKMFVSDREGWLDVARMHPSMRKMLWFYVVPMSLIPPLMYAYAQFLQPGSVFPAMQPPLAASEALFVGGAFFLIELATVSLMAAYIQQLGESQQVKVDFTDAYTLAAIAPTPLWLAPFTLFVPSLWFGVAILALAWVGSVALIRHGIPVLFRVADHARARHLAYMVTATGVAAWLGLMLVLSLLLSMVLGWR